MDLKGEIFNYKSFLEYSNHLRETGQTSGSDQDQNRIDFTALNHKRMERVYKKTDINDRLLSAIDEIQDPQYWVLINETWCGDSAQCVPVIAKAAEHAGDKVRMDIVLRDENIHICERFVPGNSLVIPRLLVFDNDENLITQWGGRPEPAQEIMNKWKENPGDIPKSEIKKEIQLWYNRDKHQALQNELAAMLENAKMKGATRV